MRVRAFIKSFARAFWLDIIYGVVWGFTFIGIFEMFYDLWRAGAATHPIWSGVFGGPVIHHMYIFALSLLVLWFLSRRKELALRYRTLIMRENAQK